MIIVHDLMTTTIDWWIVVALIRIKVPPKGCLVNCWRTWVINNGNSIILEEYGRPLHISKFKARAS